MSKIYILHVKTLDDGEEVSLDAYATKKLAKQAAVDFESEYFESSVRLKWDAEQADGNHVSYNIKELKLNS